MFGWLVRLFSSPPPAPAVIANASFEPHEGEFWELYKSCRFNGIICETRVIEAIRTDNRANIWLLISTVGAGLAGSIKAIFHVDTDIVWETATLLSVVLAIVALWKRAPEIKYTAFESMAVFDRL